MNPATQAVVGDASLQELEESLRGELIRPDHPEYHEARAVWNGAIDRHPAAIVRCARVADGRPAIEVARTQRPPAWRPCAGPPSARAGRRCRWRSAAASTACRVSPPAPAAS